MPSDILQRARATGRDAAQRAGTLVVVVGPSGSGKDTLINGVRAALGTRTCVGFVQRTISRPADEEGENHRPVTPEAFAQLQQAGAFSVTWTAHGLQYGLPADLPESLADGKCMIVNGSRHALPAICAVFASVHIVLVTVDAKELERRLVQRGRETRQQIRQRMARAPVDLPQGIPATRIDNSGPPEKAGEVFRELVETFIRDTGCE